MRAGEDPEDKTDWPRHEWLTKRLNECTGYFALGAELSPWARRMSAIGGELDFTLASWKRRD